MGKWGERGQGSPGQRGCLGKEEVECVGKGKVPVGVKNTHTVCWEAFPRGWLLI